MKRPDYTTSYLDRHGKRRWRFRYRGRARELPESPGHPEFEKAYQAALEGRPSPKPATVVQIAVVLQRSLRACFMGVCRSAEWKGMDPQSQHDQTGVAERFLQRPVTSGGKEVWGDMPVADLRRRHIKTLLGDMSDVPHAAHHVLRCIRKLTGYAIDQEWIEADPTYRLTYRPPTKGHRRWKEAELKAFESRWPSGTTPRLVYALALWAGPRRADLTRIRWEDLDADILSIVHRKTGARVVWPALEPLVAELDITPRRGDTILVTAYGKPFSPKSLTGRFRDWATAAGLSGCTMHGLRKTFGARLAEEGATTKQIQAALGHTTIQQAELYTEEADRARAAREAAEKLRGRFRRG